jgi:hypothetical protein
MKGKYKLPVFVGVSLVLVALLIVAIIQAGSQALISKEIKRSNMEIARNIRHPQGEIIELAGPSSLEECELFQEYIQEHKDAFWFKEFEDDTRLHVAMFVQWFVYTRDLRDDILYRDIHKDWTVSIGVTVRIGVTSRNATEEFKGLGIPVTLEIIDLDEVRHLEEAALEIDEKPYVLLAFYSYSKGRITVRLDKPNWSFHKAIYQEYPDYPLLFSFVDPQPE